MFLGRFGPHAWNINRVARDFHSATLYPFQYVVSDWFQGSLWLFFLISSNSSILTTLGLRDAPGAPAPNHGTTLLVANFILAYALMSTRGSKVRHGLDHNVAPRDDLAKYGEAAVQAGKLDRRTLNRLKRREAAHANAVEGYPLLVAASK